MLGNAVTATLVERMPSLDLPGCYRAAGALFQTEWNCLSGRDPRTGIRDYDLNYFDAGDLSWEAEDAAIQRTSRLLADVPAEVEIRNEARVHLWYEDKFGIACAPYTSTEAAIASFPNTSSCISVRPRAGDGMDVFAPFGFTDLFAMRTRPNPVLAPRAV